MMVMVYNDVTNIIKSLEHDYSFQEKDLMAKNASACYILTLKLAEIQGIDNNSYEFEILFDDIFNDFMVEVASRN